MMRRRSGSERRKERRSRQPGQALDVAATLLWTRQRTHARTHAAITRIFGWSFRSVALAMEVHTTGFHFSLFRITIPLYTILDNSRCFSSFDHLASSGFACAS
jgi:hypothetical protein